MPRTSFIPESLLYLHRLFTACHLVPCVWGAFLPKSEKLGEDFSNSSRCHSLNISPNLLDSQKHCLNLSDNIVAAGPLHDKGPRESHVTDGSQCVIAAGIASVRSEPMACAHLETSWWIRFTLRASRGLKTHQTRTYHVLLISPFLFLSAPVSRRRQFIDILLLFRRRGNIF